MAISNISANYDKFVLGCFMGREEVLDSIQMLEKNNIPAYLFPESAAKAIAGMHKYNEFRKRPEGEIKHFEVDKKAAREIIERVKKDNREHLSTEEVRPLLEAYGFTFPVTGFAADENSAVKIARDIGFPVALKISSPDIIHKSDMGGVALDIESEEELRERYVKMMSETKKRVPDARIEGVQVQEFIKGGKETILGMNLDTSFGPIIMFGLGGIYVEYLKDVSFRIAPITNLDAEEMVRSIRSYPLLSGVRGEEPVDIKTIENNLQRLSRLVEDFQEISEVDINPLIVFERGRCCIAVDARIGIQQ
jgi:acyl-CoA synthetase (NDP forming)